MIGNIPFIQRDDMLVLHINIFGHSLKLHLVVDFLEGLTGEKFEALFGFKAGRAQYQYLDDLIVESLHLQGIQDLRGAEAKKLGIEPLNVERARDWLNEQIEIQKLIARRDLSEAVPAGLAKSDGRAGPAIKEQVPVPTLSLRQIALLYVYQGKAMPTNADAIALKYGHTSGRKLRELYIEMDHRTNRLGMDNKQMRNIMIKNISAVIPYLADAALQKATSELLELEEE
ncbi:hypothetical protein [Hymenobacter convexus]|uniref:hypothetical protein n=1 Tax=Hymenobacter sp. CA1UV-4 TaxID=3063782 RepID=UPI00272BF80A|nr:hypothetical protein [Hymenobacter sp. CA1UV-4]